MMRNSWNPDETVYMQLNNNPFDGHAHPDSNSIVMYGYGKPLLVDSGRYSYSSFNSIQSELRYASAHNTVEAVGTSMASHVNSANKLEYSVINDSFNFATSMQNGYPGTEHTRNVLYLPRGYAIVNDHIAGSASREYRQNWHFMPSSNAVMDSQKATTNFYNEANIVIETVNSDSAVIRNGYHSADYGLVAGSKYASYGKTGSNVKFDTILYPVEANETADFTVKDIAADDLTQSVLAININGEKSLYYVKHTDEADGDVFGGTDAKMVYRSDNFVAMVDGSRVGDLITSKNNISSMAVSFDGETLAITGENLVPSTDKENAVGIAFNAKRVTLNGEEIEFAAENDMIYAVKSTDISGSGDVSVNGKEYKIVSENLITNGDFSDGTTDWTSAAGAQYSGTVSAQNAHGTSKSLTNTGKNGGNAASTLRRFVDVEDGKKYYLSYYAYSNAATTGNAQMSAAVLTSGGPVFNSFNGLSYYNYNIYGGMNSWSSESSNTQVGGSVGRSDNLYNAGMNHKEFVYSVKDGADQLMISFFAWTEPASLYLSDFELYEIEEILPENAEETNVRVTFTDVEGNEIADSFTEKCDDGTIYIYNAPASIKFEDGYYVLNESKSVLSAKTVKGTNNINAVYDKAGLVTVKFVNSDGTPIAEEEKIPAKIGDVFNGEDYAKSSIIFESTAYVYEKSETDVITVSEKISKNIIKLKYVDSGAEFDGKLAHFTFDDEETGFVSQYAKAVSYGTNIISGDAMKGKSLYLNGSGSNFISVVDKDGAPLLTGLDEITIVFYAKVMGSGANWSVYMAPDTNAQVYNSAKYVGMLHNGNLIVEKYLNSGSRLPSISTPDPTGEWKKYALVINNDQTTVYIDGVPAALSSAVKLSDILGSNSVLQIGKANWGSGEYFNGYIDEFMVYNYAMTQEELANIGGSSKMTVSYVDKDGNTLAESSVSEVLSGVEITAQNIPYNKLINVNGTDYVINNFEGLGTVADGKDINVKAVYVEAVTKSIAVKATKGDSLRSATNSSLNDFASESGNEYNARLMVDNRWYKRAGVMGFEVQVPEDAVITRAEVKLHVNASSSATGAAIYSAESLPEDWARGKVSGFALPDELLSKGVANNGYITFDVTDYVNSGNVNFAVFTLTADEYIIYDSEKTNYVPEITVTYASAKLEKFEATDTGVVYTSYNGENATVYLAYLDAEGNVLEVESNTGNTETVAVNFKKVEGAVTYKAFVWSNMKPNANTLTGEIK